MLSSTSFQKLRSARILLLPPLVRGEVSPRRHDPERCLSVMTTAVSWAIAMSREMPIGTAPPVDLLLLLSVFVRLSLNGAAVLSDIRHHFVGVPVVVSRH